jgi:hypothetical protein
MTTLRHSGIPEKLLFKPTCDALRDKMEHLSRVDRRRYALLNPAIFGEYYIKPYVRGWNTETAAHQYLLLEHLCRYKSTVTHLPVEHAKSTWGTLVLPVWLAIKDRNTRGLIISNTSGQAHAFLERVGWHLGANPRIQEDFGDLIHVRRANERGVFLERDIAEQSKEPTIGAVGTQGAILGVRLDWVIGDDILDLGNSQTSKMRDKIQGWWDEIIDSRVVADGRRMMFGTLQHNLDLLCTLSDRPAWKYLHLAGVDEQTDETGAKVYVPLWPEQWSLDRYLDKRDEIGVVRWLKTIQNDRTARIGKMLDPDWLHFYGPGQETQLPKTGLVYYMGVDPAMSESTAEGIERGLDEFCIAVIAHHKPTNRMFLVDHYLMQLNFPDQLKAIERYYLKYKRFGVAKVGIESVYYQAALAHQAKLLRSLPPIQQVHTGNQSKPARIEAFAVYSETGQFFVKQDNFDFIGEFVDFEPGGKSPNLLDACNTAVQMISVNRTFHVAGGGA